MRLRAAAVGVTLALAGGVAHAEPTADLFRKICIDTRADKAKALAAAEADGWTPVPKQLLEGLSDGKGIKDGDGRMTTTVDGLRFMLVGRAAEIVEKHPREADVCAVSIQGGDIPALKAEAARIAAIAPDDTLVDDKEAVAFAWRDRDGRRERLSAKQLETLPWDASMTVLIAGGTSGLSLVAMAVPIK